MSTTYRVDQNDPNADVINLAASVLDNGGIVIFPTETVYGIGAKAIGAEGCQELFDIKLRSYDKPIPWLVEDGTDLSQYGIDIPEYAYQLAKTYWPGPLTLVVKASDAVGKDFRAQDGTIALRSPNSIIVQQLLRAVGTPIITSSANTHKLPAPAAFDEIEPRIIEAADVALDSGKTLHGQESTVVLCTGDEPVIWREKAITADEIMKTVRDA